MPYVKSGDVRLYYEAAGKGTAIVFVHEFADDLHGWEPQLRYFSRRYRCVAFNARGYPPSDVPAAASRYSQALAADDIAAVVRGLKLGKAHVIGCSMGAFATLHAGLRHAHLTRSLTVVGAGYGSDPDKRAQFLADTEVMARRFDALGTAGAVQPYQLGPARVQLQNKDPYGYARFCAAFAGHSALGSARTLRGVQAKRPTIYSLEKGLRRLKVPLHMMSGDEDDNCLDPALFVKRVCASAWLTVVPSTGHAVNVEEPALFNRLTGEFLAQVDSGRWRPRDPRALNPSTMAPR
jgi:pimeloyl-ACP methyl ester carboxylesterase